jgi:hypothetical protein
VSLKCLIYLFSYCFAVKEQEKEAKEERSCSSSFIYLIFFFSAIGKN